MSDKQYIDGINLFPKHPKAPDFVLNNVSIHVERCIECLRGLEVNDKGYAKAQLLQPKDEKKCPYLAIDDYKPREDAPQTTQTGGAGASEGEAQNTDTGADLPF
jgi:hypothetical protein